MQRDSIDLGTVRIPRLFRLYLIPTLLGMLSLCAVTATDGIFVGRGVGSDALAAVNGGEGGPQARHPNDGGNYRIRLRQGRRFQQPFLPRQDLDIRIRQPQAQVCGRTFVHRRHQPGMELPGLGLGQLHAFVHCDRRHFVAAGLRHLQRLPSDGTAGA